jgi:hypothetical protein
MSDSLYSTLNNKAQAGQNTLGIRFTAFTKAKDFNGDDCLSKRISLVNGEPKSDGSACRMGRGAGKTIELNSLEAFADLIGNAPSNSAISIGVARGKDPGASYCIITQEAMKKPHSEDAVARTLDNFEFSRGAGLLLVDWDVKSAPAEVRAKIAAKSVDEVLVDLCPELAACGRVYRESTSSNLSHNGHSWPGSGGAHGFVAVVDATDIARATKALAQRAWLKGYGWIAISRAGSLLVRSPIDEAVASPERLIFEGAPIVVPPLAQGPRGARVVGRGLLDTRQALPELTSEEQHRVTALIDAAKRAAEPEAARVKALWMDARVAELVRKGVNEAKAREVVKRQFETHVLTPENRVCFDEFGEVLVGAILCNTYTYNNYTCADPDEPYYHNGKEEKGAEDTNVAVFYARRGGGVIFSQAHGGVTYDLCHDFDSIYTMINEIRDGVDPEVVLEAMAQAELKKVTNIVEQVKLKRALGHEIGMETRKVDPLLNKVKREVVSSCKTSRKPQLYRDDELICLYWLGIDGSGRLDITVRDLNDQWRLQNWFLARKHKPLDTMNIPDFEQWRNELLANVIVVPSTSRLLQAYARIIEKLTLYFGIHIPNMVRSAGNEYLKGNCGDYVRPDMDKRRLFFKWGKLSTWCSGMGMNEGQIEELRLWVDREAIYYDENYSRGRWWRCVYGVKMDVIGEDILHLWFNPEEMEE